jgi:hypothetical protein
MTPPRKDLETLPLEELHRLARSRPKSGRSAAAKAAALRILERRARQTPPTPELPEDVDLDAPCGLDYWHPAGPDSFWVELDATQTIRQRERWRATLEGRPPPS